MCGDAFLVRIVSAAIVGCCFAPAQSISMYGPQSTPAAAACANFQYLMNTSALRAMEERQTAAVRLRSDWRAAWRARGQAVQEQNHPLAASLREHAGNAPRIVFQTDPQRLRIDVNAEWPLTILPGEAALSEAGRGPLT